MESWSRALQEFVEGVEASVGVIEFTENGEPLLTSANKHLFEMIGALCALGQEYPLPLDMLIPSYARREIRAKLLECHRSREPQEFEQAFDLRDGTHWWRLSLKPFDSQIEAKVIEGILLTGLDITAKMNLLHDLEVSTSRFRSVVDAAYDAIITVDQMHCITLFNRAAEHMFGYEQDEVMGKPLDLLIPDQHRAVHQGYVHQFARSPVSSRQMNERNRIYGQHRDGSLIPVQIAISKIRVDGMLEFTAVIRDITDNVHLMDILKQQATTDPLTGLPNRREFTTVVNHLIRAKKNLSLLMLDVDKFKGINDTYGHDVGDEVLKALAKVGAVTFRQRDVFARIGGEEFVAVLPEAAHENAMAMAERLREVFASRKFEYAWKGEAVPFTVSIGVATRRDDDQEVGALLKRADEALYRAKEGGRNRVESGETG